MLSDKQRIELEYYIETLESIVADLCRISKKYSIPLNQNNNIGNFHKTLLKEIHHLRKTTSYEDVLTTRDNIISARAAIVKLEVFHDL